MQTVHAGPDIDRTLTYTPAWGKPGQCRLRLWREEHVAVVTETADNPGLSVTNAIETIADILERLDGGSMRDQRWRLVEHYNHDSYHDRVDHSHLPVYAEVTFLSRSAYGHPAQADWSPLSDDLSWLPRVLDPEQETA